MSSLFDWLDEKLDDLEERKHQKKLTLIKKKADRAKKRVERIKELFEAQKPLEELKILKQKEVNSKVDKVKNSSFMKGFNSFGEQCAKVVDSWNNESKAKKKK